MKKLKSLTCLLTLILVSACHGPISGAFSSSSIVSSSIEQPSSSSILPSSSSEVPSSSSSSSSSSQSQAISHYNGYYDALVSWTDGEDLKNQLHTIIRNGYKPLTYTTPNYETNINADHSKYDFEYLDVVYSGDPVFRNQTNRGWQREHAFCASLMTGSLTADAVKHKGRATDFHNLFASNASANSSRGNKNYGMADVTSLTYTNRTTNNGNDGYSFDPVNFEPGNIDKGRLSRAIFYMATMYSEDENDTINGITMKGLRIVENPVSYVAGENGAFAIGNLSTLLNWNNTYQVDYLEMQHNSSVFQDVFTADGYAQGNRNPYVDYPELVDYVYGSKKGQAGFLASLTASESLLKSNEHVVDHYALKEAKREYTYGETVSSNDYKIVKVYKDYTYEVIDNGFTHSLINHKFVESDGDNKTATIQVGEDTFTYQIDLNPMANCSTGPIVIKPDGINKSQKGIDQNVTYNNYQFSLNFETSYTGEMTINNIWSNGSGSEVLGTTFGSKTRVLSKLTIKTKDSFTIDAAYAKAFVGNNESSYRLTIKVGDTVLLSEKSFNQSDVGKVMGNSVSDPLTGQVTFIFIGSSSLKINSIAFNAIIA
ncbi:MAG: endonuclease [Bacilli bacterium]|nr:endonuclease [Bacilli bacterium]